MSNLNTYSDVTSTYLINRPIKQSRPLEMTNAAMGLMLPKGYKDIKSNAKNPELNKVIPSLNKARSCVEQLTDISLKI